MRIKQATDKNPQQLGLRPGEDGGNAHSRNRGTERTMEIRKLFGQQQDAIQSSSLGRRESDAYNSAATNSEQLRRNGEDIVNISPLSRQLSQVAQVLGEDEVRRSQRIAELKSAIERGDYKVSSRDVAEAVLDYAADTPALGNA
jgi:flagellar biosynthesis anti-sigma factor FlgM